MILNKLNYVTLVLLSVYIGKCFSYEWKTLFRDDFDGDVGTLPINWECDLGTDWGNNQVEYDTDDPNNVSVDGNGYLRITPRRDVNGNWTSARILTKQDNFRPPKGGIMSIEGKIQLPNVTGEGALGYWPAFWALGSPLRHGGHWPGVGELDFMENVNGLNNIYTTLHCGIFPGGPCDEPTGISADKSCQAGPCQIDFHNYTFVWDETVSPVELRWYVDEELLLNITSDQLDQHTWQEMTNHSGYYIILNVAIGGGFPDRIAGIKTPTLTTQPNHPMIVDYVAVRVSDG